MARRLGFLLACLLLLALPASADEFEEQGERLDEIVRLAQEGVSDAIIVKHIATSDFVFWLSADDILELRRLGVSDAVVEALLDTAADEAPRPRRQRRITYDDWDDNSLYVSVSAGYFSPWYWYPYAWGFYYDPFPSCYSFYYYPFRCATWWGYYGSCRTYYYADCWRSYRYDHWPYYDELCRRRGNAVNVPVQGPGRAEFAVARARRPAAGVVSPAGAPRRFARSEPSRRGDTPRLEATRRTRIHTRDASAARSTAAPSRRWSTPPPQPAREAPAPAARRSSPPTRHLEPASGGMRVRQGANAAPPAAAPASRPATSPAGRPAQAAPAPPPPPPSNSGSKLRFRP